MEAPKNIEMDTDRMLEMLEANLLLVSEAEPAKKLKEALYNLYNTLEKNDAVTERPSDEDACKAMLLDDYKEILHSIYTYLESGISHGFSDQLNNFLRKMDGSYFKNEKDKQILSELLGAIFEVTESMALHGLNFLKKHQQDIIQSLAIQDNGDSCSTPESFNTSYQELYALKSALVTEVGEELATEFLNPLIGQLDKQTEKISDQTDIVPELNQDEEKDVSKTISNKLLDTYRNLGKHWAPVILDFYRWIMETKEKDSTVILLLRDGKILTFNSDFVPCYINRLTLGIPDEKQLDVDKPDDEHTKLATEYLKQIFTSNKNKKYTLVDSGCYGTIIKKIMENEELQKLGFQFKTLFFYSHNPFISSYLENKQENAGLDDDLMNTLNDSLESAFLNFELRPTKFIKDPKTGRVKPLVLEETSTVANLGRIALNSLFEEIGNLLQLSPEEKVLLQKPGLATDVIFNKMKNMKTTEMGTEGLKSLKALRDRANGGEFTGILPRNSGSKRDIEFIKSFIQAQSTSDSGEKKIRERLTDYCFACNNRAKLLDSILSPQYFEPESRPVNKCISLNIPIGQNSKNPRTAVSSAPEEAIPHKPEDMLSSNGITAMKPLSYLTKGAIKTYNPPIGEGTKSNGVTQAPLALEEEDEEAMGSMQIQNLNNVPKASDAKRTKRMHQLLGELFLGFNSQIVNGCHLTKQLATELGILSKTTEIHDTPVKSPMSTLHIESTGQQKEDTNNNKRRKIGPAS